MVRCNVPWLFQVYEKNGFLKMYKLIFVNYCGTVNVTKNAKTEITAKIQKKKTKKIDLFRIKNYRIRMYVLKLRKKRRLHLIKNLNSANYYYYYFLFRPNEYFSVENWFIGFHRTPVRTVNYAWFSYGNRRKNGRQEVRNNSTAKWLFHAEFDGSREAPFLRENFNNTIIGPLKI